MTPLTTAVRPSVPTDKVKDPMLDLRTDVLLMLAGDRKAVEAVATADGTGTGVIDPTAFFTTVTGNGGSANNWVTLPPPVPGKVIIIHFVAAGEIRSSAPATVGINGGVGAAAESAVGAGVTGVFICATALNWNAFQMTSAGVLTLLEVAA
jgi:hypothetical protein